MKAVFKILPVFIIEWIVSRYCEKIYINNIMYAVVFENILIKQHWAKSELKKVKKKADKLSKKLHWGVDNETI